MIEKITQSHPAYHRKKNVQEPGPSWAVNVKTYAELYRQALADSDPAFREAYDVFMASIVSGVEQQRLNMPEATFQLFEMTLEHVKDLSPMVVIALSPPYCPPIHNDDFDSLPASVQNLTDHLIRFAADRWQEEYRIGNYIMGLTDLSYAVLQTGICD